MTNTEIIANEIVRLGLAKEETVRQTIASGKRLPFMTYDEWKRHGYQVRKGETALFKVRLWKGLTRKENGKWVEVIDQKTGKQKVVSPYCAIFSGKQVYKIGEEDKGEVYNPKVADKQGEVSQSEKPVKKVVKTEKKVKKIEKKEEKVVAPKEETPTRQKIQVNKARVGTTVIYTADDGIKYIKHTRADKSLAFLMPYDIYSKAPKKINKMYGIA